MALIALFSAIAAYLASKNSTKITTMAAKIDVIDNAQTAQMVAGSSGAGGSPINTATFVEAAPVMQGKWSEAATKAFEKAVPAGATITGTYDDEYAHIVYWTVK